MAQPLVKVSSRTFVALRLKSTRRTAGHAEAKKKKERYEQVEHQVPKGVESRWQETATTEPVETGGARSSWEREDRSR
eukprot:1770381-Pleurochrysis_carterae.AAC.1